QARLNRLVGCSSSVLVEFSGRAGLEQFTRDSRYTTMKTHGTKILTITAALAAMLLFSTPGNAAPRNGGGNGGGGKSGGGAVGNVEHAAGNPANVNVGHDKAAAVDHGPSADVKSGVDGNAQSKA